MITLKLSKQQAHLVKAVSALALSLYTKDEYAEYSQLRDVLEQIDEQTVKRMNIPVESTVSAGEAW